MCYRFQIEVGIDCRAAVNYETALTINQLTLINFKKDLRLDHMKLEFGHACKSWRSK